MANDRKSQVSPRRPDGSRGMAGPHLGPFRLTATRVSLVVALGGSVLYILYAITNRGEQQVPLLSSGVAILGLVFAALAVSGGISSYRSAAAGRSGRALLDALGGGVAALIAFGCFTAALLLALVYQPA